MHIVTVVHMFWVFGSLFLRRCGVFLASCCGSGIRVLSRRCDVSWVSCRGSGRLWSIFLFWITAYFLIVCLIHYFFAVRTCYMPRPPRSDKKPHWTVQTKTVRPRAIWQRATLSFGSRPSQRYITKRLKRPFVGRGETWPPVLALECLSGGSVCPFGLSSEEPHFPSPATQVCGETCLLVLAALLFCRRSVASAVPSRLRPGFLGIYPSSLWAPTQELALHSSFSGIPCGVFTLGCPRLCPVPLGLGSDDFDGQKSRFGLSLVSWVHLVGLHFFGLVFWPCGREQQRVFRELLGYSQNSCDTASSPKGGRVN